jgi:hypothetical protein
MIRKMMMLMMIVISLSYITYQYPSFYLYLYLSIYLTTCMNRFEFIGEPALDAGGVAREFFNLICNEVRQR